MNETFAGYNSLDLLVLVLLEPLWNYFTYRHCVGHEKFLIMCRNFKPLIKIKM